MLGSGVLRESPGMTRFLFAAMPAAGHVGPLIPLAHELIARGHEVGWYTGERYRDKVEATGATFFGQGHAMDVDVARLDEQYPVRATKKGAGKFIYDMRNIFIRQVPGQVADLEDHIGEFAPDLLVVEPALGAAALAIDQRHGLPWATCGITALAFPSRDTAPFGFGLRPPASALGRLRNRAVGKLIDATLFRPVNRDYDAMREQLGLGPIEGGLFGSTLSPYLYLQPTVPSFEYPRSELAPQVHFVGPLLPPAPAGFATPSWFGELGSRPVVLVTQGTVATDPSEVILPALEALRDEDVHVIAVTGGPDPESLGPIPANARVERYVPFAALMPHVSAYVTNGGYGGLHYALAHGVPVVSVGKTEDKAELAARVSWSGVGVGMKSQVAKPAALRAAVRKVLVEPEHAARAVAMQAEMRSYGGAATAVGLLEQLAGAQPEPLRLAA
jgi:UDP:flavonoid glycosyltransferase YjiC (YdhE family)